MPDPAALRIAANLERVRERIDSAARGRAVRLVAVTKYARPEWMAALLDAGADELGENLLPQAARRFRDLRESGRRFTAHLIGAQQSRKLRLIPGGFELYQALDSINHAHKLNLLLDSSDSGLDVLLQVNIGSELQKSGFGAESIHAECLRIAAECPRIHIRGLMAIPPGPEAYGGAGLFENGVRRHFAQMREMFDRIGAALVREPGRGAGFDILSMGMSQDYLWAVEAGATMVRVGGALFEGCTEG